MLSIYQVIKTFPIYSYLDFLGMTFIGIWEKLQKKKKQDEEQFVLIDRKDFWLPIYLNPECIYDNRSPNAINKIH